MSRSFEQILAALAALKPQDFDYHTPGFDGNERLHALTDELMTLPQPERGIRALFDVMERLSGSDLGSPGPLVHTLERMRGSYESELIESVKRKPTFLSVWMVNRILNSIREPGQRRAYIGLLRLAVEHPTASKTAKLDAQQFLKKQSGAA